MAARVFFLSLVLSLFFISQVSSDCKSNEETKHGFNREVGDRKLVQTIGVAPAPAPAPAVALIPTQNLNCTVLCKGRCSLHSRPNMCTRACGTCCVRCNCVPSGTSGNREVCGKCYTDMTTHNNETKCP